MGPVLDFKDYRVAWIAPLRIEKLAALRMLDKIHEGNFRSDPGDDYQYIGGEINGHNIVIASFPPGTQYGGVSAAALAAQVKKCFTRIWLGFLVGVAAGLPDIHGKPPRDIRLGDVLVSLPDQDGSGVKQYDFGKQTIEGFENHSHQPQTESFLRSVFGNIRDLSDVRGHTFMKHLQRLQDAINEDGDPLFEYPGQDKDHLYQTIEDNDGDDIVEKEDLVGRIPRDHASRTRVWYGNLGSGNILMKSRKDRDALRDMYNLIGLEMEAHGTMSTIPVGNIRGVCDYADQHKAKSWQPYAAAVAAAYTREVLCSIPHTVEEKDEKMFDAICLPRNTSMVPRDDILSQLDKLLPRDHEPHRAALCGLGGTGKTQLALEFAYHRKEKMSCSVFWVHATSEARFTADYTTIAKQAGLQTALKGVELLASVCTWLKSQNNWLLVLDNADDIRLFKDGFPRSDDNSNPASPSLLQYVPQTSAGSVLWTTRDGKIGGSLVGQNQTVLVGKMTDNQSLKLLRNSNTHEENCELTDPSDDERMLLGPEGLDCLALAITQAQKFMAATGTSVSEYVQMFHDSQQEVLDDEHPDEYRSEMPNSVMQTFLISVKTLVNEEPDGSIAGRILKTLAFFDCQSIPLEIIEQAASFNENGNQEQISKFRIRKTLKRIVEYCFLQPREATSGQEVQTYLQHPLLQLSMRLSLDTQETQHFRDKAIEIIGRLFPEPTVKTRSLCKKLFPHGLKIAKFAESESLGVLFQCRIGSYCSQQGLYRDAERLLSQAFHLAKATLGEKHVETLLAMNDLALIWQFQGRDTEAESLQVGLLEFSRELLGEKDGHTLTAMGNLAVTWYTQGNFKKAELPQVQVLELRKILFGEKNLSTIHDMGNLAATWTGQGYLEKAEHLQAQALELCKELFGEKEEETIRVMGALAVLWNSLGYHEKAESLQGQAVQLWKELGKEKHPDAISAMGNLALIWRNQGYLEKAEYLQIQVLKLRKEVVGEKNSKTIPDMHNLAQTWACQGNIEKAEQLQTQVLQLCQEVLGEKHPKTMMVMGNLAAFWYLQKDYSKARKLQAELLKIQTSILGKCHHSTRLVRRNLAQTYLDEGARDEAHALWKKEAEIDSSEPNWEATPWVQTIAERYGFKAIPTARDSGNDNPQPPL